VWDGYFMGAGSTILNQPYGIHWFRRDLRIADNPALLWNHFQTKGATVGVFCFDKKFLARQDFSHNRFQFFLHTLKGVQEDLRKAGGDLLVLDMGPDEAFEYLLGLLGSSQPAIFTWNRDYEPFARARDERIFKFINQRGIKTHTERDHVLIEPHEIKKPSKDESPYKVYTPFARQYREVFKSDRVQSRLIPFNSKIPQFNLTWKDLLKKQLLDHLDLYIKQNSAKVDIPIPSTGSQVIAKKLSDFSKAINNYLEHRDIPSLPGTSQFSIYLKNGSLTLAQIIASLRLNSAKHTNKSRDKFLSELIWREFYYYILLNFPHVEKLEFNENYRNLAWQNNTKWFEAWKDGLTGYPIVDAGMRQLKQTGWMHNRVRMIVASFLTKDLLIDWRLGEQWFMERLLDGDLAPNNGGWQWAASTGVDAQPYFRIFNPKLQSERFDPEGKYIRQWIPELKKLSDKEIHEPSLSMFSNASYPKPIVNHFEQKVLALQLFKK
jgi:deoxyribodipyrimidine photo-lyase